MNETHLVKRGDLDKILADTLKKELDNSEDIQKALPYIRDKALNKVLTTRLASSLGAIAALKAGFVPIDETWFWDTETKGKWAKQNVKAIVNTMPEEVKEAWERVKKLGLFQSFGVSGGRRGDPLLVGRMGKGNGRKYYLIASWVNLVGGYSIGFTMK